MPAPLTLLCADWSASPSRREVFLASEAERVVRRLAHPAWTLEALLDEAASHRGPVLVGVDAPLGVPGTYLEAARAEPGWGKARTFLEWLPLACDEPGFLEDHPPAGWRPRRPFFRVPAGVGGLTGVARSLQASHGVRLLRAVDAATGAKSVFTAGLPGQVTYAARSLWRELAPWRAPLRALVWPFDGPLATLLERAPVLGELYPRSAYAAALLDAPAEARPRLAIAKTDVGTRRRALEALERAPWTRRHGVRMSDGDLRLAEVSEDAFDALLAAAGLLRARLEGVALGEHALLEPRAEGGLLGLSCVRLDLGERRLVAARPGVRAG